MKIWKIIGIIVLVGLIIFGLIQLIPYGHNHTNPSVIQEPAWDSPETRALAKRACFDCHSNETTWPWYSNIAPVSWLLQRDVTEGRSRLNFSTWGQGEQEVDLIPVLVNEGEMPPSTYLPLHPNARLTPAEKEALVKGLVATTGASGTGTQGSGN